MNALRGIAITATAITAVLLLSGCLGEEGDDRGGSVDPVGTWGDTSETSEPSLVLADGGGLTGTDGCNRLTGSWTVDESDHVEFHDVASTRMACESVDTWLEGLSQATIADDTMTVLDQDGSEIGTLERED
ncbi:META domain-containing protein [Agromyces aureus]|uniref:DUF306 domain-containing protein n=1 Tax=Agromyces aureus TaxID=453304 RepID=A0A191WBB2_9MICO|nr:META domain-containing protein [Agromyces aureus]ANJ25545.1 hypothetical protein ATC03_00920 [Agromyces aureus]